MKKILINGAVVCATALGSSAFAQGYIGGSVGSSKIESSFCDGATTCDDKDTGFKLVGGYALTPNFAIEGMYVDLGKATASGPVPPFGNVAVSFKADGFGLFAVGIAPLSNEFSVHGRIGFASIKSDASVSGGAGSGSLSETNANVAFGFGAAYAFTKSVSVRAEWDRFKTEFDSAKADVDLLSVGVVIRF